MLPYFALFAYLAIGAVANGLRPVAARNRVYILTGILLVLIIGFRWHVGADWNTYLAILQYSRAAGLARGSLATEPGYALLNWIAAQAGWDVWFPNLICATIFTWGLLFFARRQPNPWLALVIAVPYLIIGVGMGFTRQSAALGLVMVALILFTRGSLYRSLFCLAVAATFHTSAIVIIPMLLIANAKRGVLGTVFMVIFLVLAFFQSSQRLAMRAAEYNTYLYVAHGVVFRLIMSVVPALIFLMYRPRFTTDVQERRMWTIFALAAISMAPVLYLVPSSTIVDRLGIYFVPLQMFVLARLPLVWSPTPKQNFAVVAAVLLYSLTAETVWLTVGVESQSWVPYRNYLWESWFASGPT